MEICEIENRKISRKVNEIISKRTQILKTRMKEGIIATN